MKRPAVIADLYKIRGNAERIAGRCHAAGVSLAAVVKAVCADREILRALEDSPVDCFADSRLLNLLGMRTHKPRMLLRLLDPAEAEDAVRLSDLSLQSEEAALEALGRAALKLGRRHRVILMVDLGDLREGIFFRDRKAILRAARAAAAEPMLELYGVGTNLTCFGGVVPDEGNLDLLCGIAQELRDALRLPIPAVSGGNSSSLGLLFEGRLPSGVNGLREGEGLLLGNDTAAGRPFPFLHEDAFTLRAALIEVRDKPSKPVGAMAVNAFGETPSFEDRGTRRRGILALGRQDTDAKGLRPRDPGVAVLGASSDHLIVDLTEAPGYSVGDTLDFTPGYGALMKAYTSRYVAKEYLNR